MITLLIFTYLKTTPKDEYNYDTNNQKSIEYLEKNYSKDIKLYVNYMDGSYAMFKGFKVYIDPRAEVYLKSNNQQEDIYLEYYNLQHSLIKVEDLKPNDIFQLHDVEKVMNGNKDIIYKQDRLVADECGYNTFKATSYPYMEDGVMRVECISL